MLDEQKSVSITCDICGAIDSYLPECYTILTHRVNSGWDRINQKLDLSEKPDYCNPDFHICPKCAIGVFSFLYGQRRLKARF